MSVASIRSGSTTRVVVQAFFRHFYMIGKPKTWRSRSMLGPHSPRSACPLRLAEATQL